MKITILKERLREGVGLVEKISQKSLALPILQNVLFQTEKNFLKLSATNLESGLLWWGLAKIEKEGRACVPTRFFGSLLGLLPNKPVSLEEKNMVLDLTCPPYGTKIKGVDPEDFPIIPQIKESEFVSVPSKTLCQGLSKIIGIPSSSATRPEMSGILFLFTGDLIKMVGTDSFRLAEKRLSVKTNLSKEYSIILPQDAAKEAVGIFGEAEGDLKIYLSPNMVLFEQMMSETSHPQVHFTSRLVEGEYPDYQEIIPKKYETQLYLQKEELLNQIKTASLFSGRANELEMKIDAKKEEVEISSQSPDLGEYKSSIRGTIKGKSLSIGFNCRFLIDGVSEIKGQELLFELTNEGGPAVLKPAGSQDYFYIIMPIKAS